MDWRLAPAIPLLGLVLFPGCGSTPVGRPVGVATSLECAPYARQASGIQLYGDAASWWDQAEGRYARSAQPVSGGVLVFRRSSRLPAGHVSVVAGVVSGREIRVSQANWVRHRITHDEPVVDVSPRGDWTQVRVWWEPSGTLGASTYATFGFIAPAIPAGAAPQDDLVASLQTR